MAPRQSASTGTSTRDRSEAPVLLLIEDEEMCQRAIRRILTRQGYQVDVAGTANTALGMIEEVDYDAVVVDFHLPDLLGPELVELARLRRPSTPFLAISGQGSCALARQILAAGARDYFDKLHLSDGRFHAVLAEVVSTPRASDAPPPPPADPFRGLLGQSGAMAALKLSIRKIAPHLHHDVLVLGPTVSGKERVAEALHRASGVEGPFIARSLADIPPALFASALCGHRRGTFTDAHRDRPGLLELTGGGTLFLDEIGTLGAEQQAALLRVLETREYWTLGDRNARRFEGRFVFATHEDLDRRAAEGTFRRDLLWRINTWPVVVPGLDRRLSDVPHLVYAFLDEANARSQTPITGVTPSVLRVLQAHDWRDNHVRQLRNAVHHAVINASFEAGLGQDPEPIELQVHHLPDHLQRVASAAQPAPVRGLEGDTPVFPESLLHLPRSDAKKAALDAFDRWYLSRKLEAADYCIQHAASASGMQRPNFRRAMSKVGVDVPERRGQAGG